MIARTSTTHLSNFTRPQPSAVTYDLSQPDLVKVTLPAHSRWTSGLHWHETHTEFLQIVRGRILVTLGNITKEYGSQSGVIEVGKGVVHEWRRVPDDNGEEDIVVREWTLPADGRKEVFFRMLNSFLMEPEPAKLSLQIPWAGAWFQTVIERWVVNLQLFIIFRTCDNFPVMIGSDSGWVSWLITHVILVLASWFGILLGLKSTYPEYIGDGLRQKGLKFG